MSLLSPKVEVFLSLTPPSIANQYYIIDNLFDLTNWYELYIFTI